MGDFNAGLDMLLETTTATAAAAKAVESAAFNASLSEPTSAAADVSYWFCLHHTINNMQNDKEMYQIVWLLFAFHYPNQIFSLCLYQRPNFQRILRKRLGLTWDWPEVLSMAPIVQLLKIWVWPELFSLSLLRVSLVISNEREEAFFWPIAVSELRCDTQRIMRLNRAGQPGARAQVEKDLRLHMYFCRKGLKNPSSGPT